MANLQATSRSIGVAPGTQLAPSGLASILQPASPLTPGAAFGPQLQQIVQKGGPAGQQAQKLLDELNQNPALANDPSFATAVNQVKAASAVGQGTGPFGAAISGALGGAAAQSVGGVQKTAAQDRSTKNVNNYTQEILDTAKGQVADNKNYFDTNVSPLLGGQQLAAQGASAMDLSALQQQTQARDRANAAQQALVAQQGQNAAKYNAQGQQLYNDYSGQQNALNTQDQGTLSTYLNATNPLMTQLQAHGSNPNDVAAQQAALQNAIGISNGSLNYNAAQAGYQTYNAALANYQGYNAAQAASNPYDVERQQAGYNQLSAIGQGKLDYNSQGAQSYTDPQDLANQRQAMLDIQNEVKYGGQDQRDALNTIKSRTGVAPTGEEAYLYELNRRAREAQDKSSRDATLERLAGQGLRSGGAEIAMQQVSGQQRAQDRLLADMAANANAVQRAQAYTGMQADQSNAMRNSLQNALNMQGNLSSTMRGQSFDEAYKRGLAADQASANNQGTRLSGYQGAANTANIMRGQSDTMNMFNTGQTNDAQRFTADAYNTNSMFNAGQKNNASQFNANAYNQNSMFNAGQQNNAYANNQSTMLAGAGLQANQSNAIRSANDTMSMFQDNFASQEAARVGGLAGQTANIGLGTTNQIGTRNQNTYNGGVDLNNTNYGRDKDTLGLGVDTAKDTYARDSDVASATSGVGQRNFNNATSLVGSGSGAAAARSGVMAGSNSTLLDALKFGVGKSISDQDLIALGGGY